jgi:hypothetical protein
MSEIKVQIQYTEDDFQRAYETHLFVNHPIRTRLLLIIGILSVFYSILLLVLSIVKETTFSITFGASFLLYGIGMVVYYKWKINRMGKTIFKQLEAFKSPMTFTISDDQVHTATTSGTSANRSWSSFSKALITPDMLLLYPNPINFLLFPATHFSPAEFESVKNLVRKKIGVIVEK